MEFFIELLRTKKLDKSGLEYSYECSNHFVPRRCVEDPSFKFLAVEQANVREAVVRLLEEMGYTAKDSAAIAWQRKPAETKAAYYRGVVGAKPEEGLDLSSVVLFDEGGYPRSR